MTQPVNLRAYRPFKRAEIVGQWAKGFLAMRPATIAELHAASARRFDPAPSLATVKKAIRHAELEERVSRLSNGKRVSADRSYRDRKYHRKNRLTSWRVFDLIDSAYPRTFSPEAIQRALELSDKQVRRHLLKLSKMGFIRYTGGLAAGTRMPAHNGECRWLTAREVLL